MGTYKGKDRRSIMPQPKGPSLLIEDLKKCENSDSARAIDILERLLEDEDVTVEASDQLPRFLSDAWH